MKIGIGYDAHRLVAGRSLVLGGEKILYERGLEGHSDADVLAHSIMDALLGAAGLKDIGHQFPPGDPQYKDISSIHLLGRVGHMVSSQGYTIKNIDSVIVAQEPMIGPYIDHMRRNIAAALRIEDYQITVKATTTDEMGFTGRGEGIAAQAAVLLEE